MKREALLATCLVGGLVMLVSAIVFGWSTWSGSVAQSSVDESRSRATLVGQELSSAKLDVAVAEEEHDKAERVASTKRSSRMFFEGYLGTRQSNQEQYDTDIAAAQKTYDIVVDRFEDARSTSQAADRQLRLDRAQLEDKESTSSVLQLVALLGLGVGAGLLVVGGLGVVRSGRSVGRTY